MTMQETKKVIQENVNDQKDLIQRRLADRKKKKAERNYQNRSIMGIENMGALEAGNRRGI